MTLVAVGTSLPEHVSSVAAAAYRNPWLILGNIIGGNIANILLIIWISAVITPMTIVSGVTLYSFFPIMLVMVLLLLVFI